MKQSTWTRTENAYVVCAKEVYVCVIIKLYELTNTLQLIPSLYLSSHKCYYVSNLGPSFSISLYYLHPCVTNNPISTLITPALQYLGLQALSRLSKRLSISLAKGYENNSMKQIGCKRMKARTSWIDIRIMKWARYLFRDASKRKLFCKETGEVSRTPSNRRYRVVSRIIQIYVSKNLFTNDLTSIRTKVIQ